MRILRILAAVAVGLVISTQTVSADPGSQRVALVIGNGDYRNVTPLATPANDAKLVGDALKQDGFDVTVALNLDREGLIKALKDIGSQSLIADWAVVYYAGHGVEIAGTTYLVPVDAKLATADDVKSEAVSLNDVLKAIDGAGALRVAILDASRNDPFQSGNGSGKGGAGLGTEEPKKGTVVAFSTSAGSVAADGQDGNSPYAVALAKHLTEPKVDITKLFRIVRDEVLSTTGAKQQPFFYGALPGKEFYFKD